MITRLESSKHLPFTAKFDGETGATTFITPKMPTVIDLFAGCGGFSLGFHSGGFDVRCAVEFNRCAAETFRQNFPEVRVLGEDITKLATWEILAAARLKVGECSVIIGGPPCQGVSLVGKRALDDPRNRLMLEFIRVIREARPKTFCMENVPGLISFNKGELLQEIMTEFKNACYHVDWKILNAADYGVPQCRRRVIFMGRRFDLLKKQNLEPTILRDFFRNGKFCLPVLPKDFRGKSGTQLKRCKHCGFLVASYGYHEGKLECLYCAFNRGDLTHPLPTHFDPEIIAFLESEKKTGNHLGLLKWIS